MGVLIGLGATAIWSAVMAVMLYEVARRAAMPASAIATGVCLGSGLVSFLVVRSAAEGSCRKYPAGPLGIAIGLGLGGALPLIIAMAERLVEFAALVLVLAVAHAWSGFLGGMKGLTHRFSLSAVEGVGVACAHCGYDLTATASHWPCPECGGRMRYGARMDE
ncbi:MAG: hypothetical protein HBSAPP03_21750 [Phycisphaerae bacterium]|nr:MAG: hypothetical protein HBSAPP03_21750 [Phycisphaerae bacterium]